MNSEMTVGTKYNNLLEHKYVTDNFSQNRFGYNLHKTTYVIQIKLGQLFIG